MKKTYSAPKAVVVKLMPQEFVAATLHGKTDEDSIPFYEDTEVDNTNGEEL